MEKLRNWPGVLPRCWPSGSIGPGDRVLLWGENGAEWIAAFHGCIARGVLVVPLDAYGTAEFAVRVAADVQPKLAVGDALLLHQLPAEYARLAFEDWPGALPAEEAGPVAGLSRATPLQILFTSGTTGDPKGVVLTHGNILASVEPIERGAQPYMRWERLLAHPLRFLHTLPLSHVFGQTMGLWVPPIFAAEVHFESRLVASRLIETIKRERISVLAAVPRVMALLKTHLEASHPDLEERIAASHGIRAWTRWWRFRDVHSEFGLKFWALISGGGALGGPLEQFWNALGFVVVQGYGMTETSALITLNHPFHVAHGTIGKPMAGREVKLGPDGEVLVRGAAISGGSWRSGVFQPRQDEWLATGDLAEVADSGELRFLGRKSEVIVTASGVNLHPEDMEAAIEQEPDVAACAVVAMETAAGPEPCAVLAMRGHAEHAAVSAIEKANRKLAEFQRLRHWMLWPEPDLPRTSTGKVRRKAVAAWLAETRAASAASGAGDDATARASAIAKSSDWLLALIVEIAGETPSGTGDELRLIEDLQLDSLGRVQLAAALEERLGIAPESGLLERAETLGDLRKLVAGESEGARESSSPDASPEKQPQVLRLPFVALSVAQNDSSPQHDAGQIAGAPLVHTQPDAEPGTERHIYPCWPWLRLFQWLRVAFIEVVAQPLVWLLANPRVVAPEALDLASGEPMLIIANHVTTFDGPLVQYALPGRIRRRIAVAMAGDMLADYRHFRNPERPGRAEELLLSARPADLLVADRIVQRLSIAPAAKLSAEFCARRCGHGPRLQRVGLSRGHAFGRRNAGAIPRRNRFAGEAIGSAGAAGGALRAGRIEGGESALVPLRQDRSACGPAYPIRARRDRGGDHRAAARRSRTAAARLQLDKTPQLWNKKPDFSGDFQRPNLTMRENLAAKSFQQALIPKGLKIICNVSREIYTPLGEGGRGGYKPV